MACSRLGPIADELTEGKLLAGWPRFAVPLTRNLDWPDNSQYGVTGADALTVG
jgi:hypothetical protein